MVFIHRKKNAYKVNPQNGNYGDLIIDLPKLFGQLRLIAYQNGKNVYDKQVDFDTLDLLTKRFKRRSV